ncbi:unnamed protein product [Adineta ricciae]|nr:unnamed protein product [Adineta ricciae]
MAWISIERYLLVFHDTLLRNLARWKRQLLHIVPLLFCSLWPPSYYAFTIIFSPMCVTIRYYDTLTCGLPCYLFTVWGIVDLFLNTMLPIAAILIFNLLLFGRVIYRNMTVRGRIQNTWHRHRKMGLQLGMISFLYLAIWIPVVVTQFGENFINPDFLFDASHTFYFLIYIIPLLLPMVCLMSMPEVLKTFKVLICKQQAVAVMPSNSVTLRPLPKANPVSKC